MRNTLIMLAIIAIHIVSLLVLGYLIKIGHPVLAVLQFIIVFNARYRVDIKEG